MAGGQTSAVDKDWVTVDDGQWETVSHPDLPSPSPESRAQPSWFDSAVSAVVDFGKGLNRTGNPASAENRQSATNLVRHPIDTIVGMVNQGEMARRTKESFQSGDYLQGVRHAISYLIPVLGPAIDEAGNKAATGKVAEGLGEATGLGLNAAFTVKSMQKQPPNYAPAPPKTSATATELYRTALKRGVKSTEDIGDVRQLAETGLQYKIPISEAGVIKLKGLISDFDDAVQADIDAAAKRGVTVNKYSAASRLSGQVRRASIQATPQDDLAIISEKGNQFLEAHPEEMPAEYAHAVKKGTYRSLGGKAYGEEKSASVEAQKNLARGIREELARQIPEIVDMSAEQAKMLDLDGALEKAVNKEANLQGSIFRETVHGIAVRSLTGSDALGVVAGVLRHIWKDPEFKSKLAIAINKAQQNNPQRWGAPNIKTAMTRVNTLLDSLQPKGDTGQ